MSSPRLTPEQLELARKLLDEIRERLAALSGGDRDLVFAYRRKVYKELMHDERSKPMVRRRLKLLKMKEQQGTKGELKGTEGIMSLDRRGPMIELPRAGVRVRFRAHDNAFKPKLHCYAANGARRGAMSPATRCNSAQLGMWCPRRISE